jgi:hypothetical protein
VEFLTEAVRGRLDCRAPYQVVIKPVTGAHTGPGTLGLALWEEYGKCELAATTRSTRCSGALGT